MKKLTAMFIIAILSVAIYVVGCGGSGGGSLIRNFDISTSTTKLTSAGAATVTASENASKTIIVDDSASTGAKISIPAGTFATDTTITFADITPGSGSVPSVSSNFVFGDAVQITISQSIPSGKSVTVTLPAPSNGTAGETVDLYKVVGSDWTDTGINGTIQSNGKAVASVTGFSQLAFGVDSYSGDWT